MSEEQISRILDAISSLRDDHKDTKERLIKVESKLDVALDRGGEDREDMDNLEGRIDALEKTKAKLIGIAAGSGAGGGALGALGTQLTSIL